MLRFVAIAMFLMSAQPARASDAGTGAKIIVGQTVITAETADGADALIMVALEKTVTSSQWIKSKHLPYWLFGIGAFTFMAIALLRKRGLLPTGRAVALALMGASAAVAAGSLIFAGVQPWKGLQLAFAPWLAVVFQEVGKAVGVIPSKSSHPVVSADAPAAADAPSDGGRHDDRSGT